jgi:hypothetical protein
MCGGDGNGWKRTETDGNGRKRTETDGNGRKRTEKDGRGLGDVAWSGHPGAHLSLSLWLWPDDEIKKLTRNRFALRHPEVKSVPPGAHKHHRRHDGKGGPSHHVPSIASSLITDQLEQPLRANRQRPTTVAPRARFKEIRQNSFVRSKVYAGGCSTGTRKWLPLLHQSTRAVNTHAHA